MTARTRIRALGATLAATAILLGGVACADDNAAGNGANGETTAAEGQKTVTVTNCGQEATFPADPERMMFNDGNIISYGLALGAQDQMTAVSSLQRDKAVLESAYGADVVDGLNQVAEKYPSLENIIAAQPQVFVAGWNYGLGEDKGITPDALADKGIATYVLTESCRQGDGAKRGIVDPWTAVKDDLTNLGTITGKEDKAKEIIKDMDARIQALKDAPKPDKTPTVFLFDSAEQSTIYTSGKFGAPQGIIELAGARNAAENVEDTWTNVNWELIAESQPDVFVFVDYPPQTFEEKIDQLKTNPATKDLPAVMEDRFINLPYAMWTSGPLNIDAAEYLRRGLEFYTLVPPSDVEPGVTLPADLPGQRPLK